MKKATIITASLVFAALPIAGVFATDTLSVKDKLVLTVSSSCTYDGVTPSSATSETGNEYTATATPNATAVFTSTSGATSLTVKCNDPDGHTITPTFTDLTGPTGSNAIPYRGSDPVAGTAGWTAYYSKNSASPVAFTATGDSGQISGTSTMTDTYVFSYRVGTDRDQAAGTYNGTATYVLAAK